MWTTVSNAKKINMETAGRETRGQVNYIIKHAVPSQNIYRQEMRNVISRGMKVNVKKTKLLCISNSVSFRAEVYLEETDGGA